MEGGCTLLDRRILSTDISQDGHVIVVSILLYIFKEYTIMTHNTYWVSSDPFLHLENGNIDINIFHILESQLPQHMIIHPEVTEALSSHKPLVALETTIITHGMPYPDNIKYV